MRRQTLAENSRNRLEVAKIERAVEAAVPDPRRRAVILHKLCDSIEQAHRFNRRGWLLTYRPKSSPQCRLRLDLGQARVFEVWRDGSVVVIVPNSARVLLSKTPVEEFIDGIEENRLGGLRILFPSAVHGLEKLLKKMLPLHFKLLELAVEQRGGLTSWHASHNRAAVEYLRRFNASIPQPEYQAESSPRDGFAQPFDLKHARDQRRKMRAEIQARQGKGKFRESVLSAYRWRCAISGYEAKEALEAAHIAAYRGPDFDHVQNGILLRADLHTLFDCGKLSIEPVSLRIRLHLQLRTRSTGTSTGGSLSFHPAQKSISQVATRWSDTRRRFERLFN